MAERDLNCVFCKIVAGQIPSTVVASGEGWRAIKDIKPIAEGHTVVLSDNHYTNTSEMPAGEQGKLFQAAVVVAEQVKSETGSEGYNLLVCEGEAAQSTVPHRPHFHIIPRKTGDGLHIDPRS